MTSVYGLIALVVMANAASTGEPAAESKIMIHTDSPVYATGKLLLQACSADETTSNGREVCKDYIGGVVDTITSNRDVIQGYQICWPKPAPDLSDLRVMLVKYLRDHPEVSEGIGASVVDAMLFEEYRCPGTRAPSADGLTGIAPAPVSPPPR